VNGEGEPVMKNKSQMSTQITEEETKQILSDEGYLPVGTVVLLKGGERKLMIVGLLQINGDDDSRMFDYSGVIYPEGLIDPGNNYLFDEEQIDRIYYLGFVNEEQADLQTAIKEALDEYNAAR
jgi:hypothetical protein